MNQKILILYYYDKPVIKIVKEFFNYLQILKELNMIQFVFNTI